MTVILKLYWPDNPGYNTGMVHLVLALAVLLRSSASAAGADRLSTLARSIECSGASPQSCLRAAGLVGAMFSASPDRVLERLDKKRVRILIAAPGSAWTELLEAQPLMQDRELTERALGMPYAGLRGMANIVQPDGSIVVLAAEDALYDRGLPGHPVPGGAVLVHELGHAVYSYGLDAGQRKRAAAAWQRAKRAEAQFPDRQSAAHATELFAQAAAIWFGLHYDRNGGPARTAEWLIAEHPDLAALLRRIFGAPRRLASRPGAAPTTAAPSPDPLAAQAAAPDTDPAAGCSTSSDCVAKARRALQARRYAAADSLCSRAISLDPEDAQAWEQRAAVRSALGQTAQAQADLGMAERLQRPAPRPDLPETRKRGLTDISMGKFALQECRDFNACYTQADLAYKAGDCRAADRLYTRAISLKPQDPWAWLHRSLVRYSMGSEAAAREGHRRAVQLSREIPADFQECVRNFSAECRTR